MELSTLPASDFVEIITSSNPETIELSILPASDSIEMIASSDSETVELSTLPASDFAEMIASFNPETMEASTLPASNSAERITSSNPERVELSTLPASDSAERITSSNAEIVESSTLPASDSAERITSSNPETVDFLSTFRDYAEMIASSNPEIVESSTLPASDSAEMITFNPETVELSTLRASHSGERITSSNRCCIYNVSTLISTLFRASSSAESITFSNAESITSSDSALVLLQLLGASDRVNFSTFFPASDSPERITSSNPEIMDQRLYLESELYKPTPGMWQFQRQENPNLCCIYRVPDYLRHANPEAYTPQLVLIGPLHHSLKYKALECRGDIANTKAMNYLNMERHKKTYLAHFARRRVGSGEKEVIDEFRKTIKDEEGMLRASYSESTDWISSSDFVEMIMLDCVFIIELLIKWFILGKDMLENRGSSHGQDISSTYVGYKPSCKTGDPLLDERTIQSVLRRDLTLLENQIPYFMLEKIYGVCIKFSPYHPLSSLRFLANSFISPFELKTKDDSQFKHFTDMARCVLVETLPEHFLKDFKLDETVVMYHADKLHSGGVKFKAIDNENSMNVKFKNGCLYIPCFPVYDSTEEILRNIIALEQCHYSYNPHVSNYINFLDLLIDTEKDVALLVEKGILRHMLGDHSEVAKMVNKLCVGVSISGSQYNVIAKDVQKHYNSSWTKSSVILRNVYFSNLWRGTATVAAMFLLLLTLVQAVFSILQFLSS